jgi:heme-degrading monooxygenase HmoA
MTIARLWHGRVPTATADAYLAYLNATGVPDYRATPGNRGVTVLRRADGDVTHFLLMTQWESWAAIAAFAGEPVDRARYYPEDDNFLLEREPTVVHYEACLASARRCR